MQRTPLIVPVLLFGLVASVWTSGRADERPNVVLVMTDDQGYGDLGVHGNSQIVTPHIDRFARSSIELTRFYVSPVCAPTRSSLLTGRYHYRTGVIHTSRGGAKMHGDEVTIAELLQQAGYHTGIFGKWHLGDTYPMRPQDQGFDESLVHKSGGIGQTPDRPNSYFDPFLWHNGQRVASHGYCTDVFFDAAITFIERCCDPKQFTGEGRRNPLFVYLPTNAPHTPLEVSPERAAPYLAKGLNETTAKVYAMITNLDENFGRLLACLDRLGIRDDTIVVFFCDNGPQQNRFNAGLRGRKASIYEGGIRVPFFVQWRRAWSQPRRIDRIAAHIDVLPTLLDLCGVDASSAPGVDGISLAPLLRGTDGGWPDRTLFFQCHRGLEPKRYQNCAAVTQRFKLVGFPGTFSQEDLDTSSSPVLELYDLDADPSESHDLATQHPDALKRLKAAYERWFQDVRRTRNFQPGVIQIGSDAENPTVLCRYQDSTYRHGQPTGWSVEVLRSASYRASLVTQQAGGPGHLCVSWRNQIERLPVRSAADAAVFTLRRGRGVLDIWYEAAGQPRQIVSDHSTEGDVLLTRLSLTQGTSE